ncbi:MAG: hypothetical protein OEY14_14150, partial [Myxococcales bacterium]|nr:hypothetical protein [Myxococcales bacterium]
MSNENKNEHRMAAERDQEILSEMPENPPATGFRRRTFLAGMAAAGGAIAAGCGSRESAEPAAPESQEEE